MEEDKRDWSTGFTRPYYKVFPFVKENVGKLGWLALLKFIVTIIMYVLNVAMQIILRIVGYIVAYVIMFAAILLFALLVAIGLSEVTAGIVVAVILILILLILLLLLMVFVIALGGAFYGIEIYISRKILDIFKGEPVNFDIMRIELKKGWKIYLEKGVRLYLVYMMVLAPIVMLPILLLVLAVLIIIVILIMINAEALLVFGYFMMYIGIFVFIGLLFIIILLINPFVIYILDWACLRMADGSGAWESVKEAITYVWKKPKLMKYYWVAYVLINLVSMFISPLAMIVSFILPILTKVFVLINDEEYG